MNGILDNSVFINRAREDETIKQQSTLREKVTINCPPSTINSLNQPNPHTLPLQVGMEKIAVGRSAVAGRSGR